MFKITKNKISLILILLIVPTLLFSQENKDMKLLNKIHRSAKNLSYEAKISRTYFTENGENISKRIITKKDKRNIREEFLFPDEFKGIVFIAKDNFLTRYYPSSDSSTVERLDRRYTENSFPTSRRTLLLKNYELKRIGDDMFDKHRVEIVKLIPLNHDRSKYKIWIGNDNGYIFKLEKFDQKGDLIYREVTESVEFNPEINDKIFKIKSSGVRKLKNTNKIFKTLSDVIQDYDGKLLVPKLMPLGFVLDKINTYVRPNNAKGVKLTYTDGLSSISLYQRKGNGPDSKINIQRRRRTIMLMGLKMDTRIWIVSDIPEDTLRELFKDLKPIGHDEKDDGIPQKQ